MKCPKCHYLSFDPEPRCRNCGYTLALDPDLQMHVDETTPDGLDDFSLKEVPSEPGTSPRTRPGRRAPAPTPPADPRPSSFSMPGPFDQFTVPSIELPADEPTPDPAPDVGAAPPLPPPAVRPTARSGWEPAPAPPTTELPLFVKGIDATEESATRSEASTTARTAPLVPEAPAAPPPAPAVGRRSMRREPAPESIGPLERDLLEGLQRIEAKARREAAAELDRVSPQPVEASRRAGAAIVDLLLLVGIAGAVLGMTLRWVDLPWNRWSELPWWPLLAFFVLIATGYLFLFTAAGGQTIGKMLSGIRVVDAENGTPSVTARQALYRSLLAVPSVAAFGAGFLPALTGDRRALHDRLAGTRVVRG